MNPETPSQSFMLAGASALTKPSDVFQISPNFEHFAHNIKLRTLEWRLLFAIDGYRTVREICSEIQLDEDQAREIFGKLSLLNLIQEEEISLEDFLQRSPNQQGVPALAMGAAQARPALALPTTGFRSPIPNAPVEFETPDYQEMEEEIEEETPPPVEAVAPPSISRVVAAKPPPAASSVVVDAHAPARVEAVSPSPIYVTPVTPRAPAPQPVAAPPPPPPVLPRAFVPAIAPAALTPPKPPSAPVTLIAAPARPPSAPVPLVVAPVPPPPPAAPGPTPEPKTILPRLTAPVPVVRPYEPPMPPAPAALPAPPRLVEPPVAETPAEIRAPSPPAPARPLYGASPLPGTASVQLFPAPIPPPPIPTTMQRSGPVPLLIPPIPALTPLSAPFPSTPPPAVIPPAASTPAASATPATSPVSLPRVAALPPLGRRVDSPAPSAPPVPSAPSASPAQPTLTAPIVPPPLPSAPAASTASIFLPPAPVDVPPRTAAVPLVPSTPPPAPKAPVVEATVPAETPASVAPAPIPTPPAPPAPAPRFRMAAVVEYISKQAGGGTLGQLATYRVLLQVPPELLRESGIRSLEFDNSSDIEIKNPELQLALVAAIERTLNIRVPSGQFST